MQSNSFFETVYHKLQHKWHCLAVYCIFYPMRTTVEQNLKLLIDSCTINFNSDALRPLCWVLVVRRGWGSLIRRGEVSFKSGIPYSTFLLPEDSTLVWRLVSYGQSQTSVWLSDVCYFRVLRKVALSWYQINGVSEPPWSPIDSNKTKQSSEKSNTAGFINTLRKEFQPPDLKDVQCLTNAAIDYNELTLKNIKLPWNDIRFKLQW